MTLSQYCKSKNFTLEMYDNMKQNIDSIAAALILSIPQSRKDNGMYYPVNELIPYNTNKDIRHYLIQSLKSKGIEFIDNNTLWRY